MKINKKSWHYRLYRVLDNYPSRKTVDICQYIKGIFLTIFLFSSIISILCLAIGTLLYKNYQLFLYCLGYMKWTNDAYAILTIDGIIVLGILLVCAILFYRYNENSFLSLMLKKIKSKTCFYADIE